MQYDISAGFSEEVSRQDIFRFLIPPPQLPFVDIFPSKPPSPFKNNSPVNTLHSLQADATNMYLPTKSIIDFCQNKSFLRPIYILPATQKTILLTYIKALEKKY